MNYEVRYPAPQGLEENEVVDLDAEAPTTPSVPTPAVPTPTVVEVEAPRAGSPGLGAEIPA